MKKNSLCTTAFVSTMFFKQKIFDSGSGIGSFLKQILSRNITENCFIFQNSLISVVTKGNKLVFSNKDNL